MRLRAPACALLPILLLSAAPALADRVVVLPSQGGADPAARAQLDAELIQSLTALGHTAVPNTETLAALARVADGSADTPEEYAIVAGATQANWVVGGRVEPAVATQHVELAAYLASMQRVESVAREVNRNRSQVEVQEMVTVLLRPEGIGVGALPWEQAPAPPQPPPQQTPPPPPQQLPPPPPPGPSPWQMGATKPLPQPPPPPPTVRQDQIEMSYVSSGKETVWPPYAAGRRIFVNANIGFASAVAQPEGATGGASSFVGALRGGYAVGDAGLELFGQLGGNLSGPPALWLDAGGRWMLTPIKSRGADGRNTGFAFHVGPELYAGLFMRLGAGTITGPGGIVYESESSAHASFGAALDAVLALSPAFRLEAQLGNLRVVPTGDGAIVTLGMTAGASLRF
ncbi:hypothetical protein [Polyangium aurulentum]|uniref:hypothetical protein n=1 Tax=Polyangium aurulentum TaxID=2567896 RepID=UPI0010AEDF68|nr:hypothetical protein [Polyangium aurulentum]UQA61286.1 hypothetical protein E8A73_012730 [Polyangium aurulentum]